MKIPEEVLESKPTDDRGRLYLGPEYANKEVEVAVIEVREPDQEPSE